MSCVPWFVGGDRNFEKATLILPNLNLPELDALPHSACTAAAVDNVSHSGVQFIRHALSRLPNTSTSQPSLSLTHKQLHGNRF